MKAVGIREIKSRFSEYLRLVKGGEEILVTDRGEVVAELRRPGLPATKAASYPGLVLLARQGAVVLGADHDPSKYRPRRPRVPPGTAIAALDDSRGER
ncbi:MAG: type II toxin-antitoxin system prevent-host-death family antitoxin [Acidobacteriota bacterium]